MANRDWRFKVGEPLGEGTYGHVYFAKDYVEKRLVALKKLKKRGQDGIDYNAIQEIRQLSELSHENIVRFVGAFPQKHDLYLAFEYLPATLDALIKLTILNSAQIKCIMKMLLEGLKYLHGNYIMHRDLKPQNIMLDQHGILKLVDFGLSTDFPPDFGPMISQVVTRWYKAPELCFGAQYYGPAIDMWSVGCIFAEMLRGEPFLPGDSDFSQLQLIANYFGPLLWDGCDKLNGFMLIKPNKPVPKLSELFPALQQNPEALDLIRRLFCLDPLKRISAADALEHPYFKLPPTACMPSEIPVEKVIKNANIATSLLTSARVQSTSIYAPGTALARK